jgi:pyruvate/2-oxoglutarate dehydrogenase complex dihydrolipoamide dehydrogenase (E3) component
MEDRYDLIVIGGGAAGLVASGFAGLVDVKVALIEREHLGGDCTWTGCMPSKALLKVAKNAHAARSSAKYGIHSADIKVDMRQVRDYVQGVVQKIYQAETPEAFAKRGVDIILGEARFLDPHTVQVGERVLCAKRFIIATGARPYIPPTEGLGGVPFKTSRSIFQNDVLPQRLLVMGAGPIGMELAQAYARFGSQVFLIDNQLLSKDEPEVAQVMGHIFEREGVCFVKGQVVAAGMWGGETVLTLEDGTRIAGDMLLVATGRVANVESLNLDKAGVAYSRDGIQVNEQLRTNIKHIYAVGDCVGGPFYTHRSGFHAVQAARNALFPGSTSGTPDLLPWVTFTDPEVAHVGLTEAEARQKHGAAVKVHHFDLEHGDRAVTDDAADGFIKMVYKGRGDLLGVTIVAERAGEMLTEFTLAMKHGLSLNKIRTTLHAYPTYSDIVQKAVTQLEVDELVASPTGTVLKTVARWWS